MMKPRELGRLAKERGWWVYETMERFGIESFIGHLEFLRGYWDSDWSIEFAKTGKIYTRNLKYRGPKSNFIPEGTIVYN